jgi:starch-binding outer membrane protein SusE/F
MKNILKIIILSFLIVAFISCEDTQDPLTKPNGFAIRASTNNSPLSLTVANNTNTFLVIDWDKSDNGVDTSEASYFIEVAKAGTNFENAIVGNLGSAISLVNGLRTYKMKVQEINDLANKLPNFSFCEPMNIDVRIKSRLGDYDSSAFFQPSSNFITVNVTPYSTAKSQLAIVSTGANPTTSPILKSSAFNNNSNYEGYAYLTAGDYKFYQPDACGDFTTPQIYGGTANVLTAGSTSNIVVPLTGHYLIKANLSGAIKTYSLKYFTAFGLFGTAKGVSGSGNAVPMIDAENNNVWKLTISLANGRIYKFKSQNWTAALSGTPLAIPSGDPNTTIISTLGTSPEPNGLQEVTTGGDITVPGTTGSGSTLFDIVIDVSNPRKYTYTATKK